MHEKRNAIYSNRSGEWNQAVLKNNEIIFGWVTFGATPPPTPSDHFCMAQY